MSQTLQYAFRAPTRSCLCAEPHAIHPLNSIMQQALRKKIDAHGGGGGFVFWGELTGCDVVARKHQELVGTLT